MIKTCWRHCRVNVFLWPPFHKLFYLKFFSRPTFFYYLITYYSIRVLLMLMLTLFIFNFYEQNPFANFANNSFLHLNASTICFKSITWKIKKNQQKTHKITASPVKANINRLTSNVINASGSAGTVMTVITRWKYLRITFLMKTPKLVTRTKRTSPKTPFVTFTMYAFLYIECISLN